MGSTLCAYVLLMTLPLIASNISNWTKVRQDITRDILNPDSYDKRVRPSGSKDSPTTLVQIGFMPLTINALDTVTQTMVTTAWMALQWRDDRLTWDGDTEDKILHVPQDEIWRPDVSLQNSYTDTKALGSKSMHVSITPDGYITWYPYQIFQSNCVLDTRHFPFDIQTCGLQFATRSFNKNQLTFAEYFNIMSHYQPSNQFDVINYIAEHRFMMDTSVVIFKFELQRKPLFVVMTTVIPIATLALLSICVFILPFESGEKISYSVTVFLAFMVTLTYVSTILPENSENISYLAVYVTSQVAQSTLQTFVTIILCRLYNFDDNEKRIPKALVFLIIKACCSKKRKPNSKTHSNEEQVTNEGMSRKLKRGSSSFMIQYSGIESDGPGIVSTANHVTMINRGMRPDNVDCSNEDSSNTNVGDRETECVGEDKNKSDEKEQITWKDVVNGLDAFCFIFFLLLCIACTTIYFAAAAFRIEF